MRTVRIVLWGLVALAAVWGLYFAARPSSDLPLRPRPTSAAAAIGGPFTLVDTDGKPFGSSQLAGKPYALFFGFTHCPDVCPTTLARLERLRREIRRGDDSFAIVLVTVDPERDTPAELKRYASLFAGPVIALTGSSDQIDSVKRLFGAFSRKVPGDAGYSVEHTATVFLMDRAGGFRATIAPDEGDAPAKDKLRTLAAL